MSPATSPLELAPSVIGIVPSHCLAQSSGLASALELRVERCPVPRARFRGGSAHVPPRRSCGDALSGRYLDWITPRPGKTSRK
jgi:hypothetical protein